MNIHVEVAAVITAVCMNPAFDKTVTVDALAVGHVNRVRESRVDMGGKGVNVAVVARRLGLDAQCIGCMGEDGAQRFAAMMDAEGIRHRFLTVPGTLRTNMKIVSLDGSGVTELNEPGAAVEGENLERFFTLAKEEARRSDMVAVTGSLPPGCPEGTYRELMRAMEAKCILDVGGRELMLGVEARPMLIKPNIHELEAALGVRLHSRQEIAEAARALIRRGAGHALVSMGGDGAMLVTADKAYYAPCIPVEAKSTVGAGDAMVGGVLKGLSESGDMVHAFRCGVAAGTASVMTEGTQLIRSEDFLQLMERVRLLEV